MRKALITAATRGRENPCLLPQRAAEKSPDDGRNASCVPCSPCPTPVPGDAAAARAAYYNGTAAATCPNQTRCVGYGAVAVSQKPLLHLSHFFIWGPRAAPGFLQSGWEHTVILPSCARKPACSILELLPRTLGSASCCLAVDEKSAVTFTVHGYRHQAGGSHPYWYCPSVNYLGSSPLSPSH